MEKEIVSSWYRFFCHEKEITRILEPKTSHDHLLKMRAELINENMRLFRVYRNKALIFGREKWELEKSFSVEHFNNFLDAIPKKEKQKCENITYGNLFSNDPTGFIMNTEYGPLLTISESLEFFLKFLNLSILDFGKEVPFHVRRNSLRIALRLMMKTETMDFLMDPRGIIPKDIQLQIDLVTKNQMQFIAGHEFSHFLLGHLSKKNMVSRCLYSKVYVNDQNLGPEIKIYNISQQNEFNADLKSLELPNYEEKEYYEVFMATIFLFIGFELYEHFQNIICPVGNHVYKTHPSGWERVQNIIKNAKHPKKFSKNELKVAETIIESLKKVIDDDLAYNYDQYEVYGSCYLDEPNSKWRGKKLEDRVDYY